MRIGSVVVDCNDFDTMVAFWQEALHYIPREPPEHGWVVLRDPAGSSVNVSFQHVPEPRAGKNRLHFDLYTDDQACEVDRLLASAPPAIPAKPTRTTTSSSSRTPRATCSAWSTPAGRRTARLPGRKSAPPPPGRPRSPR